jgi:hypothetical protein
MVGVTELSMSDIYDYIDKVEWFFFFCIVFKFIDNDVHEMILAAPREGVRLEILCYGDIQ